MFSMISKLKDRVSSIKQTPTVSKLRDRLNTATSDIQKARERRKQFEESRKLNALYNQYIESYESYSDIFDEYKKERDEYAEVLSEWKDDETREKERKEFQDTYVNLLKKTQELESAAKNRFGNVPQDLKQFKENIMEEAEELTGSEEQTKKSFSDYNLAVGKELQQYSGQRRWENTDPRIIKYDSYANTWYLEDTGKRVGDQFVYKVVDYRYKGNLYPTSRAGQEIGKEFIGKPISSEEQGRGRKSNVWLIGDKYTGQKYIEKKFDFTNLGKREVPFTDWKGLDLYESKKIGKQNLIKKMEKQTLDNFGYIPKSAKGNITNLNKFIQGKQDSFNKINNLNQNQSLITKKSPKKLNKIDFSQFQSKMNQNMSLL